MHSQPPKSEGENDQTGRAIALPMHSQPPKSPLSGGLWQLRKGRSGWQRSTYLSNSP